MPTAPRSASRVSVAVAHPYDGAAGVSAQTSVGSRARSAGCYHVWEGQVLQDLPRTERPHWSGRFGIPRR
jgi:hypothetical protein